MWNDTETKIDFLGYESLVQTIVGLTSDQSLSPLTIGIHGDWGAGKSSLLRMIETKLLPDSKTCCLTFNGWLFQGYDDTKSILMETIIRELVKQQPTNVKLKSKAKEMLSKVDWFRLARVGGGLALTGLTGIPDVGAIKTIVDSLESIASKTSDEITPERIAIVAESLGGVIKKTSESASPSVCEEINAFRLSFEELLESAKIERLVVLVDDLDRCLPATAIDTLEAIRLFLFVPGTVFVLAADEGMISYAVKRHFPDLPVDVGQTDYTKNYLEKLIQVPFRIPPLGKTETRTYITLLLAAHALSDEPEKFDKILSEASSTFEKPWENKKLDDGVIRRALGELPEKIKDILLLVDRICAPLTEGLSGNPRQIKRFLNTFMVRQKVARAQGISALIDEYILAKLMLLERFDESTYKQLAIFSAQSSDGTVDELIGFEEYVKKGTTKVESVKKEDEAGFPKEWKTKTWLLTWAKIEPSLTGIDLRPYIYISREKIAGFISDGGLGDELENLARRLATGAPTVIVSVRKIIQELNSDDALKIFNQLISKARKAASWKTKPTEIDGLYELVKYHQDLQEPLVMSLENIPHKKLGIWAATGMKSILSKDSAKVRFNKLLETWKTQSDNPSLSSAAKNLSDI